MDSRGICHLRVGAGSTVEGVIAVYAILGVDRVGAACAAERVRPTHAREAVRPRAAFMLLLPSDPVRYRPWRNPPGSLCPLRYRSPFLLPCWS
jgi:hypothetical protein